MTTAPSKTLAERVAALRESAPTQWHSFMEWSEKTISVMEELSAELALMTERRDHESGDASFLRDELERRAEAQAALNAEIGRLRADNAALLKAASDEAQEVERLRAHERDAERYRWARLRELDIYSRKLCPQERSERLDRDIDAAIAREAGTK